MKTIINKLPSIIKSAFDGDSKQIEKHALYLIKQVKKDYPEISNDLSNIIFFSTMGNNDTRSIDMSLLPIDNDSKFSLLKVESAPNEEKPILEPKVLEQLEEFIEERSKIKEFINEGVLPSNTLLLVGEPGVGKSHSAKWIASSLNIPILTLDLASTISSYLGKSGQNIKQIFEYAKSKNIVLFLDEIDAIAKRRDDMSDLGELKRLVNVLLKEIEDSPSSMVIIAASNHPELLDKALWRRFDRIVKLPLPNEQYREKLLLNYLNGYRSKLSSKMVNFIAKHTQNKNASDIRKLAEHIIRKSIMHPNSLIDYIALKELFSIVNIDGKDGKIEIVQFINENFSELTQTMISEITGVSTSTVSRYLKK